MSIPHWPPGRLAAGGLPFLLVTATAFSGGGYDALVRGQVGFALWWLVLLGGLLGLIRLQGIGRPARAVLALLSGLAVWTAASVLWSDDAGASITEAARVVSYLGVLVVGFALTGRGERRLIIGSITAAIAFVGLTAVLSRLHPQWFPLSDRIAFLSEADERLSYPLNYWNGVATLIATGLPLLVYSATRASSKWLQAASAAAVPALILGAFLTFSRGGSIAIVAGLAVLIALHPRRLTLLPTLLLIGAGAAVLVFAADARTAFADGLRTDEGLDQAGEMLVATLLVCAVVAAGRLGLISLERRTFLGSLQLAPTTTLKLTGGAVVVVLILALLGGAPGTLSDKWDEFKTPATASTGAERLSSASGNGRYQWWSAAVDAGESEPLIGTGAGTYEYWWLQNRTIPGFVRDAHSLYLETFGELGFVGLLLLLGLVGTILGTAVTKVWRAVGAGRELLAAATAAMFVIALAAAGDWVWEQAVLAFLLLLLAAVVVAPDTRDVANEAPSGRLRATITATACAALVAIGVPLLSEHYLLESRYDVRAGKLDGALQAANRAKAIQPYAAEPRLQQALVLESQGKLDAAAEAAEAAVERAPTNWETWVVLSRIAGERGDGSRLSEAFEEARRLNPRSPLFNSS